MIHPPSKPFLALMPDMTSYLFPHASHPHTRTQIHLSGSVHLHETAMNVHHSQNSPLVLFSHLLPPGPHSHPPCNTFPKPVSHTANSDHRGKPGNSLHALDLFPEATTWRSFDILNSSHLTHTRHSLYSLPMTPN